MIKKTLIKLYTIAAHHPFYQGNKRTAIIVAELILILEVGSYITADEEVIDLFVCEVASYLHEPEDIESWIRRNC